MRANLTLTGSHRGKGTGLWARSILTPKHRWLHHTLAQEPLPLRVTLCGLLGSEVTVPASVALSVTVLVGLKVTATAHDELPASVEPQVVLPAIVKSPALRPLTALSIDRVNGDMLV